MREGGGPLPNAARRPRRRYADARGLASALEAFSVPCQGVYLRMEVEGWAVGQRVGVGFLAASCGHCVPCRAGDLVSCQNQAFTGVQQDGGYAEVMIAKASGLMSVPDDLPSVNAAPLLCAGLTTFSALRNSPARAGDLVAVLGVGGLGHLGVQYARHMGFEVIAIDRGGDDKAELAKKLGAHHYVDSAVTDIAKALQER